MTLATPALVIVGAVVTGAVGIIDATRLSSRLADASSEFVHPAVGVGLYAVILGAGIALAEGLMHYTHS
jgi:hypothetical protein